MDKDTLTHELRSESGASIEFLNAEEILEIEPAITPIFEAGYLMPDNGHCKDPFGLANGLVKMFSRSYFFEDELYIAIKHLGRRA